jgi:hypothetical protein
MAERFSPDNAPDYVADAAKFIIASALFMFAIIGIYATAPLRRK